MVKPILSITHVARRLGISTKTIRIYEEEGLIRLERQGNRCLIHRVDVEALVMAERLKSDLGVNLAGIGVIMDMRRKIIDLQTRLAEMEADFDRQIEEMKRLPRVRDE